MAVPLNQSEPYRGVSAKNSAASLRIYLGSAGVDPKTLPTDPQELVDWVNAAGISTNDTQLLNKINQAKASTQQLLAPEPTSTQFGSTISVTGDKYVKTPMTFADELDERLLDWEARARGKVTALGRDGGKMGDYSVPLSKLPYADSTDFSREFAEINRLRETMEEFGAGQILNPGSNREFGRMIVDPSQPLNVRGMNIGGHNIKHDPNLLPTAVGEQAGELYRQTGDPRSLAATKRVMGQLEPGALKGKTFAIMDLETGGLSSKSGVWNLAVRYSDDLDRVDNLLFQNDIMDIGSRYVKDASGTGGKTMSLGESLVGEARTTMPEFKRTLRGMVGADMIAGHNIGRFDLPFLMDNLETMGVAAGEIDDEFLDLAKQLSEKVSRGEFIDTVDIAKHAPKVAGLEIAPELVALEKPSPNSLENILLQTNTLDKTSKIYGFEQLKAMQQKGTHAGDVDTMFEWAFLKGYIDDDIVVGSTAFDVTMDNIPGKSAKEMAAIKDEYLAWSKSGFTESGALTPYTTMGWDEIHPDIQKTLIESGDPRFDVQTVNGLDLRRGISPLEHNILGQRAAGSALPGMESRSTSIEQVYARANMYDRYSKDMVTGIGVKGSKPVPTAEEFFRDFQKPASKAGLPYAGLSQPEREVGRALAGATTSVTPNRAIADVLADSLLESTWYSKTGVHAYESGSGVRIAIAPTIMSDLEQAGAFDVVRDGKIVRTTSFEAGTQAQGLSPFTYVDKETGITHTNVAKATYLPKSKAEAKEISANIYGNLMERRGKLGFDSDTAELLSRALVTDTENVELYGLQTGLLRPADVADSNKSVQKAFEAIAMAGGDDPDIKVTPVDRSTNRPIMTILDSGPTRTVNGMEVTSSGAPVLTTGMTESRTADHLAETRGARRLMDEAEELGTGSSHFTSAVGRKTSGNTLPVISVQDAFNKHIKPNKNLALGGLAATVAAGAYYLHRRGKKKDEYFTDTFDAMPKEEHGWYQDYSREMTGKSGSGERRDSFNVSASGGSYARPLASANVVSDLDDRKIGHTTMGIGKNANLFGG